MNNDPSSWPEAKPPYNPGPIWNFTRGYKVNEAGRHENEEQYRAFQFHLNMRGSRSFDATAEFMQKSPETLKGWAKKYNWDRRCAAYDKKEMAITFKEASKIERKKHRYAIEEFRQANEDQARLMMDVSGDLMGIIQQRIAEAAATGEKIPMGLLSGLMRAAANISDAGRQAWATSLGVNELMTVVEQELEEVQVEVMEDPDVYEIPLDED
jgi:hypothetical protein